jgi:hypothetical protein
VIALGVLVKPSGGLKVECVVLSGEPGQFTVSDSFDLKATASLPVDQIDQLGKALASALVGIDLDVMVIRSADRPPAGANGLAAALNRIRLEGVLAFVGRDKVSKVHFRNGKDIGRLVGGSKAQAFVIGEDIELGRGEAAAAALSGLTSS